MLKRGWLALAGLGLFLSFQVSATKMISILGGIAIPIDKSPVAEPDEYNVTEDIPLVMELLSNDSDENLATVTISVETTPSHGTVELSSDARSVTYSPNKNSNASDSFTYRIIDEKGNSSEVTSVLITIDAVDDEPVFSSNRTVTNSSYDGTFSYGIPFFDFYPLTTLTDVDDELNAVKNINLNSPLAGTLDSLAGNKYRWNIPDGFYGPAEVHFSVMSGGVEYWYNLIYLVLPRPNTPPVISGPSTLVVREGESFSFNFATYDAEGDPMTYSVAQKPSWLGYGLSGNAFISGTHHQQGEYQMEYWVSDGYLVSKHPITLVVLGAGENTPPYFKYSPEVYVNQWQQYQYSPTFSDLDGDNITLSISNKPSWLTFNTTTGELTGFASTFGVYSNISITASDGTQSTVIGPFDITVVENRAPLAVDDAVGIQEGEVVNINVLSNDSDPDGDALSLASASVAQGSVTITSGNKLQYTAPASFDDGINISYTVSDGHKQASANVILGNFTPPKNVTISKSEFAVEEMVQLSWENRAFLTKVRVVGPDGREYETLNKYLDFSLYQAGEYQILLSSCSLSVGDYIQEYCGGHVSVNVNVLALEIQDLNISIERINPGMKAYLNWRHYEGITYEIQHLFNGNNNFVAQNYVSNTIELTPTQVGNHQYRVRICGSSSNCGDWSAYLSLEVTNASIPVRVRYKYDALGRLIKVTDPVNGYKDYELDPAGNRRSVTTHDDE